MISIASNVKGEFEKLKAALGDASKKLPIEISAAINATAKKATTAAARALAKELPVPVKILKKAIKTKQKASPRNQFAVIRLWQGHPIPLKYYKASQTKSGVTVRYRKVQKTKSILRSAFIAPQYGGNVYKRQAKPRGPLEQIYGPAPGEAYVTAGIAEVVDRVAKEELPKQINNRVRLVLLRASGKVAQRKGY